MIAPERRRGPLTALRVRDATLVVALAPKAQRAFSWLSREPDTMRETAPSPMRSSSPRSSSLLCSTTVVRDL